MTDLSPKPFVFVLMPFSRDFDDVYQLGIRPACDNVGAYAERVDEQIFQGSILQRIYNQIAKADLVVADMSHRNANVFYETGYAHALGKPTILLTQAADDIPFDLKHYPHIVYSRIMDVIPELERRITALLHAPVGASAARHLVVSINGVAIDDGAIIDQLLRGSDSSFKLLVHFFNSVDRGVALAQGQVAFATPPAIGAIWVGGDTRLSPYVLPDGRHLFLHPVPIEILPGGFDELPIVVSTGRAAVIECGPEIPLVIRFLTVRGYDEYSAVIRVALAPAKP
jgi:hypothetical protein